MRTLLAGSLIVLGRSTGMPSSSAAWATGVPLAVPERPRGLSGWVTTRTTSWAESASARRGGTAASGLPA